MVDQAQEEPAIVVCNEEVVTQRHKRNVATDMLLVKRTCETKSDEQQD